MTRELRSPGQPRAAVPTFRLHGGRARRPSLHRNECRKKLWGRSSRPLCRCLLRVVSAFSFLRLSFWLPWIYSPFPFFMEFRNGDLLQLFECIESTQNEVKRKMIVRDARNDAPRSPARRAREKSSRNITPHARLLSNHAAFAARMFYKERCGAIARQRIFGKVCTVYNERRFCNDALLEGVC